jgi:hypothetical protein
MATSDAYIDHVDVVMVRWPSERQWRDALAGQGTPRLLLVEDGVAPPDPPDCLEDWIRPPVAQADLQARTEAIVSRASLHRHLAKPALDEDGILRFRAARVPLAPVEARVTAALLERFEAVVSRAALTRAGWPGEAPKRNALDVHVLRLRRRMAPAGLAIRTVRSRGYLLEVAANDL